MMNRILDRSNPKDKFIIETLLPYLVEHIEESNSKGTTISQISSMYVFPYRTNEGIKIGSLREPGISWYFDKNNQKQVVSSGGYRILEDSVLPEKQAANFRKTFSEYCGITEFSDHAVIKDLLEKMSMETDYTSRWWTYAYDVFKLWRKEDFNSSLEKATEGMDNNKFLFLTDVYPENLKQRLLENDVFSDIKETSFKTCFWNLMKSRSDEKKAIDVLIRMGVPHTFVVNGEVNAHLLKYFAKVSENSDYPVESWEKAFAECELSHDIMLQIYREDEDALFEIATDGDINAGIVVKNIMGAYVPLSWDLFFASDELEINNSEEDDLEEDKELGIDSDLESLHINGKEYSLDLLSRLENVHEYSEVCEAADYYNLGVDCEIVEFYKWIWLYSHHDELVENILYFFTDDEGERVTVPEADKKFVLSVLECGDISDAGYLFDINLDAESCFSNADVINKISRQFSDIYCNISADLKWFDVSDYLPQIIAAVNSVSNIQIIAADLIWDYVYLVDGEPDHYDDIYVRCKLFDDGYKDVLLIWNSSDEDSYIRALAKYVSEQYNTEVVVACAEAFDWKAEYLQLAKKIREFISEAEPIKKENEVYGYIADMADVLTFGEEKQIWMNLVEQREKIVQQQVGKMPINLENWRTFLAAKYNGRCQVCGNKTATGAQNAHFFTYRISKESQSKLANMSSNMFCLCPSCHGEMQYGSYMGKNMSEILEKAKLYFEYYTSKFDSGEMEENYESLVAELSDDSGELKGFSKPIICDVIVNGKERKMAFSWEHFIRLAFILADIVDLDNEVKNEC